MICHERERLSIQFRNAAGTLAELAIATRKVSGPASADELKRVELALAASAQAQVALLEHMDEHRCWTHAASSLLQLRHCGDPRVLNTKAASSYAS